MNPLPWRSLCRLRCFKWSGTALQRQLRLPAPFVILAHIRRVDARKSRHFAGIGQRWSASRADRGNSEAISTWTGKSSKRPHWSHRYAGPFATMVVDSNRAGIGGIKCLLLPLSPVVRYIVFFALLLKIHKQMYEASGNKVKIKKESHSEEALACIFFCFVILFLLLFSELRFGFVKLALCLHSFALAIMRLLMRHTQKYTRSPYPSICLFDY